MNKTTIQTGDKVGADWRGPYWTPFGQAIADNYANIYPWFSNVLIDLGPAVPDRKVALTKPQQHDVLIMGAHVKGTAGDLPFIFLQINDTESGVFWQVPNIVPGIPLTAFGGVNGNNMPNMKFPEAFFLRARTQLKLQLIALGQPALGNPAPITITLIGVQMTRPRGGKSPETVSMPDAPDVRVDGRMPLFATMGVGERQSDGTFFLTNSRNRMQFIPPLDCDAEIHDLSTNMISTAFGIGTGVTGVSNLLVKFTVMGVERQWTQDYTPVTSLFGGPGGAVGGATQAFPATPLCKPYLLKKGRRIKVAVQNTSLTATFTQGLFVFRGVRLCEY